MLATKNENDLQWIRKVLAGKLGKLAGPQINFWEAGAYCQWRASKSRACPPGVGRRGLRSPRY
jgi:hypothetical protein